MDALLVLTLSVDAAGDGHVNTVYFVDQAQENTRISRTQFVYDERAHDCKCLLIFELPA